MVILKTILYNLIHMNEGSKVIIPTWLGEIFLLSKNYFFFVCLKFEGLGKSKRRRFTTMNRIFFTTYPKVASVVYYRTEFPQTKFRKASHFSFATSSSFSSLRRERERAQQAFLPNKKKKQNQILS